jgi:hypothetical protein
MSVPPRFAAAAPVGVVRPAAALQNLLHTCPGKQQLLHLRSGVRPGTQANRRPEMQKTHEKRQIHPLAARG